MDTHLLVQSNVLSSGVCGHSVPANEFQRRKYLLVYESRRYKWQLRQSMRHIHCSLREMKKPWSTVWPSSCIVSSNVFTISTSRPFCVPRSAPITRSSGECVSQSNYTICAYQKDCSCSSEASDGLDVQRYWESVVDACGNNCINIKFTRY